MNSMTASEVKPAPIGGGILYQNFTEFGQYFHRLLDVGVTLDIIEYLAVQYATDQEYLGEIHRSIGADLPSTLHSFEYMIGSVSRPADRVVHRLQHLVELSNCLYIGEHVGMMGTSETYSGTFLQPFGTDEQTQRFIDNLLEIKEIAGCALTIENQSQVYSQIGPRSMCEQVRDIAEGADVGILLSLSNFMIAEKTYPMDTEKELEAIPLERVWQIHLPIGCVAELAEPEYADYRRQEQWGRDTLEQLFKEPDFQPVSIIFEIQDAGTPSYAEPERVRDSLDWARDLMGMQAATNREGT